MKFFLPLFLFFFIISNIAISEQKIVFVDMDRLVSVSKPGSSIFNQLKDINNKNLIFLKKEGKKFKEKEAKVISQKNILSENDFGIKVNELKSQIKIYNQNRNKMISEFNKLKVDNTNKLLKLINPIIVEFASNKKISIILQKKNIVMGATDQDITDEIIKIINSKIEKFKIK